MRPRTAVMILAAGGSARLGRPKQLLEWNHTSLVGHAIATASASVANQVFLILGSEAAQVRNHLPDQYSEMEIIVNPNWQSGIGSSIAAGMQYLLKQKKLPHAVLIMLCDQPLIDADHLNRLIHGLCAGNKRIAATAYRKGIGVPAVFLEAYFPRLASLEGEHGARDLLRQYSEDSLVINAGTKIMDIDTDEDYDRLREIADDQP